MPGSENVLTLVWIFNPARNQERELRDLADLGRVRHELAERKSHICHPRLVSVVARATDTEVVNLTGAFQMSRKLASFSDSKAALDQVVAIHTNTYEHVPPARLTNAVDDF